MEKTKKILNVAISVSLVLSSLSLLIFTTKQNTAHAQVGTNSSPDVVVAGLALGGVNQYYIIGYNTKTQEAVVLGDIHAKNMKKK